MGERFFGAIAEAYKAWNAELVGFLNRQLKRSPDAAQDLAQETFARWLAASRGAEPPEKPRAYLYEIARNLLRDHWRREAERKRDKSTRAIEINCWDIPFQGGISWDDL